MCPLSSPKAGWHNPHRQRQPLLMVEVTRALLDLDLVVRPHARSGVVEPPIFQEIEFLKPVGQTTTEPVPLFDREAHASSPNASRIDPTITTRSTKTRSQGI